MKILITTCFLLSAITSFSQDSTLLKQKWELRDALSKEIKSNRSGKGNSTFSISYTKLSTIIKNGASLKVLESQLGGWNSYGYENRISYAFNEKTNEHDLPELQINYETRINNISYSIIAQVKGSVTGKVTKLTITAPINGTTLAQFKQTLKNNGYLLNQNLSDIYRKEAWDKKGQPLFTIRRNTNGGTTIGVF